MYSRQLLQYVQRLRWVVPLCLAGLVVFYELGPALWINNHFGQTYHLLAETLFYGTLGPLLSFLVLDVLRRWMLEREARELQDRVLQQTQEQVRISRGLNDDALQTLFAAGILLSSLKKIQPDLPADTAASIHETEVALDRAIVQLRKNLENQHGGKRSHEQSPAPNKMPHQKPNGHDNQVASKSYAGRS
jgi:signal transduction histidine kinase